MDIIVAFSAASVNARSKRMQRKYAITVRKKAQPYGYASVMSPADALNSVNLTACQTFLFFMRNPPWLE